MLNMDSMNLGPNAEINAMIKVSHIAPDTIKAYVGFLIRLSSARGMSISLAAPYLVLTLNSDPLRDSRWRFNWARLYSVNNGGEVLLKMQQRTKTWE